MREWKLLKYVTSMLANTIFDFSRGKSIRYNQYSMPWQTMGPLFAKGQSVRRMLGVLAPICNSSKSTCGSITLPYLLHILAQEGDIDLEEFCLNSFGDETYAESLSKLLEKSKK
jgi:replication factor C large subunit